MKDAYSIFIDESGGTSPSSKLPDDRYYVLVGVVVANSNIPEFEKSCDQIKQGNSEIKASSIRSRDFLSYVSKISKIDYRYYVLIVDKQEIDDNSGVYKNKQVYIKFFVNKLIEQVAGVYDNLKVFFDAIGDNEFRDSLTRYVHSKNDTYEMSLLKGTSTSPIVFDNVDSKAYRGVQIADFTANVFRRLLNRRISFSDIEEIVKKKISIDVYPTRVLERKIETIKIEFDSYVSEAVHDQITNYISENIGRGNEDSSIKIDILQYLLNNPQEFTNAEKISRHLSEIRGIDGVDGVRVRREISKMRSKSLPIASSKKGYKVPYSMVDVNLYIQKVDSIVDPYVMRLGKFRDLLKKISGGGMDILDHANAMKLKHYLDTAENALLDAGK
ncbi:DUF3800 domain-containing protein [Desulfovibrio mangrovi]|uniref:DUF3800 domain-containing protein n=1 Tax=Desulfovibrio mangrovi TaxID=2976983 RepID=UPI002245A1F3|nr:DUF3800 domain-containing protein [Desulfovibrio mangrovi]UZP68207.1 DUF3800 domain-containing protein [Desulfovibrio mangrovi]